MAIINKMPSGAAGAKFKHEIIFDSTLLKTMEQTSFSYNFRGTIYYLDDDYLGFKPDGFITFAKFVRDTEPSNPSDNDYHVVQVSGFFVLNEAKSKVCVMYGEARREGSYKTDYQTAMASDKGIMTAFNTDERKLVCFGVPGDYPLAQLDYLEIWAWAE